MILEEDKVTVLNIGTPVASVSVNEPTRSAEQQESKRRKWFRVAKKISLWTCISVVAFYVAAVIILYPMQKRFMYKPTKHGPNTQPAPPKYGWTVHKRDDHAEDDADWSWKEVKIHTPDQEVLSCYWLKHNPNHHSTLSQKDLFTVVYFHGRSDSVDKWIQVVERVMSKVRCNVLMVSYRGFGASTGSPDETGMKTDAQAALDWVFQHIPEEQKQRLVVFGQSMGGAVAINLAAKNPDTIKYLIVENTFLSLPKVAERESAWFILFRPFIHQIWDSESDIQKVKAKILFLSAANDKFIPPEQMKKLFELATAAESKTFQSFAQGGHNNAFRYDEHPEAIANFLYNSNSNKQ